MSTPFVIVLGLGTVFTGLIVIILLCKLMSFFTALTEKPSDAPAPIKSAPATASSTVAAALVADKKPIIAAISAVVAEELGTDISNIRIHSIKRI